MDYFKTLNLVIEIFPKRNLNSYFTLVINVAFSTLLIDCFLSVKNRKVF